MNIALRSLDCLLALDRRRTARLEPARGLLLVAAGGLGDAVLLAHVLPRFRALARAGEPVTLVLRHEAAKMEFLFGSDVAVRAVDFHRLRRDFLYRRATFKEIYALNVRLALSADYLRHPWLDEALVAAAAAPETAAMIARPWPKYQAPLDRNRRLYTRMFDSGPARRDKIVRWTAFANWLGGRNDPLPKARLPDAILPPKATVTAPLVILQPFSAVPRKQVPLELWRRVIAALPHEAEIRVTGSAHDFARHPEYRALLDPPRVRLDDATFAQLMPSLRAARLVVSVDTALMHLAIAAGAPTLGLASAAYV
ncbi:MAG: lipopolysaccharide heptosyltransferase family protein, partial [Rhodospirillales bacterium]|nr:lipopolysaccharide heptosyltransferase family protein [Rhodospirillales bacterium]